MDATEQLAEALYLMRVGQLHVDGVESGTLPPTVQPAFKAVNDLISSGVAVPIPAVDVWRVARDRYNGKDEVKEFIRRTDGIEGGKVGWETVRDNLVLRRLFALVSEQIASGKYDLTRLRTLLEIRADTDVKARLATPPTQMALEEVFSIPTFIEPLDAVIGGVGHELIIVSARPKQGKSTFFGNLVARSAYQYKVLYVTVADYGYDDYCRILCGIDPNCFERSSIHITDFTSSPTTLVDVEKTIMDIRPDVCVVDRAEKLQPLRKLREPRWEVATIFDGLRRLAKKYKCPIWTDSQLSAHGGEGPDDQWSPIDGMAEDRTGRAATLDLFIGLRRYDRAVGLKVYGRRPGMEQGVFVKIQTSGSGRYLT